MTTDIENWHEDLNLYKPKRVVLTRTRGVAYYIWVKIRMLILSINLPGLARLLMKSMRSRQPIFLFVLSDNTFQSPSPKGLSHRHLEKFFQILNEMKIDYLVVRPLFGKRVFKAKSEKIYSLESLSFRPIISVARTRLLYKMFKKGKARFNNQGTTSSHVDRTWELVLKRIKPSIVFGQNLTPSLIRSCKESGIETVEIQHGVWFENQMAVFGFDLNDAERSPTFFLTWHRFYDQLVGSGLSKAMAIGYPSKIIEAAPSAGLSTKSSEKVPLRILVALSVGVVESTDPYGLVRSSIDAILRDLKQYCCEVIIRPHPLTGHNFLSRHVRYRWLQKHYATATVIAPHQQSIADAIMGCDAVVTFDGTMVIDAVMQGKIALHMSEDDRLGLPDDILKSGLVTKYESHEQTMKLVARQGSRPILTDWQFNEERLRAFIARK